MSMSNRKIDPSGKEVNTATPTLYRKVSGTWNAEALGTPEEPELTFDKALWILRTLNRGHAGVAEEVMAASAVVLSTIGLRLGPTATLQQCLDGACAILEAEGGDDAAR
jgi:hypothetical protein